jgi:hypothetical protein
MTRCPDVQKRAQQESDAAVGEDRSPAREDYEKLAYVAAVKESMRWRPVVPLAFPHVLAEGIAPLTPASLYCVLADSFVDDFGQRQTPPQRQQRQKSSVNIRACSIPLLYKKSIPQYVTPITPCVLRPLKHHLFKQAPDPLHINLHHIPPFKNPCGSINNPTPLGVPVIMTVPAGDDGQFAFVVEHALGGGVDGDHVQRAGEGVRWLGEDDGVGGDLELWGD